MLPQVALQVINWTSEIFPQLVMLFIYERIDTVQLIDVLFSPSLSFCSGCDRQQSGFIIHSWEAAHGPKCDPEVLTSQPRFGHAGPPPSLLPWTPHLSALLQVFPAALAGKGKRVRWTALLSLSRLTVTKESFSSTRNKQWVTVSVKWALVWLMVG